MLFGQRPEMEASQHLKHPNAEVELRIQARFSTVDHSLLHDTKLPSSAHFPKRCSSIYTNFFFLFCFIQLDSVANYGSLCWHGATSGRNLENHMLPCATVYGLWLERQMRKWRLESINEPTSKQNTISRWLQIPLSVDPCIGVHFKATRDMLPSQVSISKCQAKYMVISAAFKHKSVHAHSQRLLLCAVR